MLRKLVDKNPSKEDLNDIQYNIDGLIKMSKKWTSSFGTSFNSLYGDQFHHQALGFSKNEIQRAAERQERHMDHCFVNHKG